MFVTAEELLAGKELTFDIDIPQRLLCPSSGGKPVEAGNDGRKIKLRPLTVRDVQKIAKAAREDEILTSALMIQLSAVEPELTHGAVASMRGGLVSYLVEKINQISGLSTTEDELKEISEAPIVQAFFVLAKEFGWTPGDVKNLTIGQLHGYLEMINQGKKGEKN